MKILINVFPLHMFSLFKHISARYKPQLLKQVIQVMYLCGGNSPRILANIRILYALTKISIISKLLD